MVRSFLNNFYLIFIFAMRNLKEEKLFSFISIFGVALGVGLFLSILNSTQSAIKSMTNDIERLNPMANYEIVDKFGNPFDESILDTLNLKGIRNFPVIKINGQEENRKLIISIYGVDSLKLIKNSNIDMKKNDLDLLLFFQNTDAVFITDDIGKRINLKKGDEIQLNANGVRRFIVAGLLDAEQIPSGFYQDIGNFQEKFKYFGKISRIDLMLDVKQVDELMSILPENLILQEKSSVVKNRGEILKSFKMNLYFISFIAFLVGFFMLFNTIFITVVKQREQIGVLRTLGGTKYQILSIFVFQALLLGTLGSFLGLFLGGLLSIYSSAVVEDTISTMFSPVYIKGFFTIDRYTFFAFFSGIFISFISSIFPALESTKVNPSETVKKGTFEIKFKKYYTNWFIIGVMFVSIGITLSFIDFYYKTYPYPYLSYIGVFFILMGFCASAFLYLDRVVQLMERFIKRIFKAAGFLSFADIRSSSYRFTIALVSVAISTALIVSMVTLIDSFKISLGKWINDNLKADIFIKAASCSSNFCFEPLNDGLLEKIKSLDGVAAVSAFRAMKGSFNGKEILLGFGDEKVVKKYHNGKDDYVVTDSVAVSEFFNIRYGLKEGDTIEIDTPKGRVKFKIREVFTSYSNLNGFIILDNYFQKKYWDELKFTQISIYLKEGVDRDQVLKKLEDLVNVKGELDIFDNQVIRKKVLKIFDKTFAITYAIQGIALIVSLLGVGNMLYAVALERRREISILKYLGTDDKLLTKIYTLSAGFVGVVGTVYGFVLGYILSVIIVRVVNTKSFGWSIAFHIDLTKNFYLLIILVFFVILSGLLPIKTIKQLDPKRFVTNE
ncbi:MAG: ABC transporter permease [Calditerrivibrio nitroreducens]|uniref:ABC transporter permease n=1 Tax=Calditerrivibrio nitroreducens TaxID=477976 RepID=A0A2J6WQS3_9BACT|nr:MAG: ABC transporter permease [Calditerrivibrio nitroreducens]